MDENLEFKYMISKSAGTDKGMILSPYARDVEYKDGFLSFALDFFTEDKETEIGIRISLEEDLSTFIEGLMSGDGV